MSGLLPRMRPAWFRGAPFHVDEAGGDYGRRWADHEYAGRDRPYAEPLGRAQRIWNITGYTLGPAHRFARALLLQACEQRATPGELIHPAIGVVLAVCRRVTWSETREVIGRSTLTMEFAEPGELEEPSAADDSAIGMEMAADALGIAAAEQLMNDFSVTATLTYVASNATYDVQTMAATLEDHRLPESGYEQASAAEAIDILYSQAPALVHDVPDLTRRTTKAFATTSNSGPPDHITDAMLNIANSYTSGASAQSVRAMIASEPARTRDERNKRAWQAFCRQQALREVGYAMTGVPILSQQQGEQLGARIKSAFETAEQVAADAGNDDVFLALIRLRGQIEANIRSRPGVPAMVVYRTLEPRNALVLAWEFYHDANRDLELVEVTNAINPAFMPMSGSVRAT
jgi:prophage DNA circulation protein